MSYRRISGLRLWWALLRSAWVQALCDTLGHEWRLSEHGDVKACARCRVADWAY